MKKTKRLKAVGILAAVCIAAGIYLYGQNNWISAEQFLVESEKIPQEFSGFRVVQISDVHLPKHASGIGELVALVEKQNPDLIVMTGDLIDAAAEIGSGQLAELCGGLSALCDVYAVTGNHEVRSGNLALWRRVLTEQHVTILDNTFAVLERGREKLVLSGVPDGALYAPEAFAYPEELEGAFHILLAHRPERFDQYCAAEHRIRPDLVFSGHAHGGQFRIPLVGGLVAPNQGFFPAYTSGVYASEHSDSIMIVSRGLGNSIVPVRINNRPHLPVVTLQSGGGAQ